MASISSLLALAFLFGLQHAFDADHMAAVAVLKSPSQGLRASLEKAVFWGTGHMVMILSLGFLVLVFGMRPPEEFSLYLDKGIGVLLIVLGVRTAFIFWKTRKSEGNLIIHNHPPHGLHAHPYPSFFVGMLHGLAGSAGVFVLTISLISSVWVGLLYLFLFSLGVIGGMLCVGLALGFSEKYARRAVQLGAAIFSCATGISFFM